MHYRYSKSTRGISLCSVDPTIWTGIMKCWINNYNINVLFEKKSYIQKCTSERNAELRTYKQWMHFEDALICVIEKLYAMLNKLHLFVQEVYFIWRHQLLSVNYNIDNDQPIS